MSLSKVLEIARLELGVTENPAGSNRVKYWDAYDLAFQGQPWCVAFLWWCFREAGERMAFFGGGKTASCGTLLRWYREQGLERINLRDAEVGDLAFFNFSSGYLPEHCGLVTEVKRYSDGTLMSIKSIEGNTTVTGGSESNGGCVAEKTRYPRNIVSFCRPTYKADEPQSVDDVSGHWAEAAIRRCMERGLMKGYPDGSFQPDKPVTRAELAVILDRLNKEDDLK